MMALLLFALFLTPVDTSSMQDMVVMYNGRMKPLSTHARESVRRALGETEESGLKALDTYASLLLDPESWEKEKFITPEEELALELFGDLDIKLSVADVREASERLRSLIQSGRGMEDGAQKMQLLADQAMQLMNQAFSLQDLSSDLFIVPHGGDWFSMSDARRSSVEPFVTAFDAMKQAYLDGDQTGFDDAVANLIVAQRQHGEVLSRGMVSLENLYYAVDVRKVGLLIFILCSVLYFVPSTRRIAFVLLLVGIAWNLWIIGGRTAIGGRLPLKNLNEVYLVVLFAVPAIGLLLQSLFKNPVYGAVSAILSVIGFTGSLFLKAHGYDISPLMAILISPWREVHILTIMLSYAILLVAMGLHLAFLILVFFQPSARTMENGAIAYSPLADDLDRKAYLMVVWGFLFLTVGITTGAAWAHSSWGRYWGWDPKEVWATVAWAIYAAFLHLRIFFHVRRELLALINIIGFAAILFTYFGVTYLLSGLHAYS